MDKKKFEELLEQETKDRTTISRMLTVILEQDELVAELKAQIKALKESAQ